MDYQLVIQFNGDSLSDYDVMISLEDTLSEDLAGIAEVDGHDMGSGQTNIFMIASDPLLAFDRAKVVLARAGLLPGVTAAYRPASGDAYTVLWPPHQHTFSVA